MNNFFDNNNNINKNNDNLDIIKNTIRKISDNDEINDKSEIDKDLDNIKTIENNFTLNEEPNEQSQDFAVSLLDGSKKNNLSDFSDNNELNLSNNNIDNQDNVNSIQVNKFFNDEKNGNISILSNIPIEKDEISKNTNKNNNINKAEKKGEKIINCRNKPLYEFLMQIHMEKYYDNLNNNGFEYINMIIDDTKL